MFILLDHIFIYYCLFICLFHWFLSICSFYWLVQFIHLFIRLSCSFYWLVQFYWLVHCIHLFISFTCSSHLLVHLIHLFISFTCSFVLWTFIFHIFTIIDFVNSLFHSSSLYFYDIFYLYVVHLFTFVLICSLWSLRNQSAFLIEPFQIFLAPFIS